MKKIGIATFYAERNYGAVLQAYALQEAIKTCGCEVEFLQFHEIIDHSKGVKTNKFLTRLQFLWKIKGNLAKYKKLKEASEHRDRLFSRYQFDMLNIAKQPLYDIDDAKSIAELYDGFVSGSDMVWTPMGQSLDFYFLTFANKTKRLSYAPSLTGVNSFDSQTNEKMKEYLSGINSLCFREQEGAEYAKKSIGRDAPIVVDPTLLLTKEDWVNKLDLKKDESEHYLLCYLFGKVSHKTRKNIQAIAKEKKLTIRYISLSYEDVFYELECKRTGAYGPREFVELYYNADFVVTNTFHGFMFSLIMEKPFVVLHRETNNKWAKNEGRISSVLKLIDCYDRYINPEESIYDSFFKLDYSYIIPVVVKLRTNSRHYLEEMLKSVEVSSKKEQKLSNIGSLSSKQCTGCLACIDKCPQKCITKTFDSEGFYIPKVNNEKCIECSLCTKVCPAITTNDTDKIIEAYSAFAKTGVEKSASGGMFITIARHFINKLHGVVVGCVYDEHMNVKHVIIESAEELESMQNSKYVQSDTSGIYLKVLEYVKLGKRVLFCGTPCQVSAIKKFAKNNELLFTIDILCHGVPSPRYWGEYLSSYNNVVTNFQFRKRSNKQVGKTTYCLTAYTSKEVIEKDFSNDIYYNSFIRAINYRYSCYYCNYANLKREGDLTIGDCDSWKYDNNPCPNECRSFISVNNKKGENLFDDIKDKLVISRIDVAEEAFINEALKHPAVMPSLRRDFYSSFKNLPFNQFVDKYQKHSVLFVVKKFIAQILG